jgi:hypothetical protein
MKDEINLYKQQLSEFRGKIQMDQKLESQKVD